jgi:hypothetical protein
MSDKTPSESLAAKLQTIDFDENELRVLDRIFARAEGGDVREVEVEGFSTGGPHIPMMPDTLDLLSPGRLRRAVGVSLSWECEDEPTIMCRV